MIEITESLLEKLGGPRAYERGVGYFEEGRVCLLEAGKRRTTAIVNGSYPYRVELRHTQRQLDGACNCPISEGVDFCKHCVAVALALGEQFAERAEGDGDSDRNKIKAYLELQDRESLIGTLIDVLPKVRSLEQRLLLEAEVAEGSVSPRQLKKWITQATRSKQLWDYREVAAYFARIEAVLENILSIADRVPAKTLLAVALYGILRVDSALEEIDDSSGYRYATQKLLCRLHIAALMGLDWPLVKQAAHVLELALLDPWDQFAGVPGAYSEALGQDWLDAFYARVEDALSALPKPGRHTEDEAKRIYQQLVHYLQERAEAAEDWDALIDLEQRIATTPHQYEEIAKLFLHKGGPDAAAECLDMADSLAGREGSRGSHLWVAVHIMRDDWDAAGEAQRVQLGLQPSFERHARLMDYASRAGCADRVQAEVKAFLSKGAKFPWADQDFAFTLPQILKGEQDWEGVRSAIHGRVQDPDLLREARPLFESVDSAGFADYIRDLRTTHRQKRNLIAALDGML